MFSYLYLHYIPTLSSLCAPQSAGYLIFLMPNLTSPLLVFFFYALVILVACVALYAPPTQRLQILHLRQKI